MTGGDIIRVTRLAERAMPTAEIASIVPGTLSIDQGRDRNTVEPAAPRQLQLPRGSSSRSLTKSPRWGNQGYEGSTDHYKAWPVRQWRAIWPEKLFSGLRCSPTVSTSMASISLPATVEPA